jgi:muramoyltetrapeptide carboxypeptidase
MLLKPPHLKPGDTIGIVAPASPPSDPGVIEKSLDFVSRLGFKPKLARNARQRAGFLAGSDRERAADLMSMFLDRRVSGILCVRGGYGSSRLLPLLDYRTIRRNPKVFVGYSDITSLHSALLVKAGLVSFHGPMLSSDFIKEDLPAFTTEQFLKIVRQPSPLGSLQRGHAQANIEVLRPGVARGRLLGGNISILCSTLATPFQPSFRKRILFFEDVDEAPYKFDRMLTQLLNAGLLQQLAGIAIGVNKNCLDPKAGKAKEYRQSLLDVFVERLRPLKIPIVAGLPFGHVSHNATIPVGVMATLDGDKGDLLITEPAVK